MSRIYRALEKAEEEKRRKLPEEPSLKLFEEKRDVRKEASSLKVPEEKITKTRKAETLRLPQEEVPVLVVPPHSIVEEEFRKLKTRVFIRLPNPPHSILVTSAAPKEGKTTVAVNLAMAIAKEIHRKAILIDGDLRKPGIHLEKIQNPKGLSSFLSDGIPLSEILIDSEMENLRIIMSGPSSNKSSELIGSKRMEDLMKSLRESGENTYIVIDSPPIISTTEPTLLSKMVDGIILVVRADRMPRELIQKAVNSIDRQKIIGVVFNQIGLKTSSYHSKRYE